MTEDPKIPTCIRVILRPFGELTAPFATIEEQDGGICVRGTEGDRPIIRQIEAGGWKQAEVCRMRTGAEVRAGGEILVLYRWWGHESTQRAR